MKRFLKWTIGLLLVAFAALFVWGYAPDKDPAELRRDYASKASKFVELEPGLKVHVRDEGKVEGPALLLIHGSSSSLHTWEPWVQRLGTSYRIISLDLTGHGLTGPHPKRDYAVPTTVAIVDRVMAKLNVDRFAVAGNSMGGLIAWNYALAHPDKLTGLVLIDASGAPDSEPKALPIGFRIARMPALRPLFNSFTPRSLVAKSVDQTLSVKSVITDDMVSRYYDLLLYPGNRQATGDRQDVFAKRNQATLEAMATIKVPTLILWGDEDGLVPVTAADWFANAIPGARKIIYKGVGHIPMEEVPDQSAADVAAFMDGLAIGEPK